MSFWCQNFFQKINKIFSRISTLPSKMRSHPKNKGTLYYYYQGFYFDSLRLLFWFELFLEAREKFSLVFLEEVLTPKGHLEINWLLVERFLYFVVTIGSVEVCNVFKNAVHQIRPQISFLWINITVMPEGEKYWGCQ